MSRNIPEKLRYQVAAKADFRCEYCLIPAEDSFFGFQVDHIISKKHGGATQLDNLAFSCPDCNRHKGSDLATILDNSDELIRFYHPRLDLWNEHFEIHSTGYIADKSKIGKATIKIFDFNHPDRIIERRLLIELGIIKGM